MRVAKPESATDITTIATSSTQMSGVPMTSSMKPGCVCATMAVAPVAVDRGAVEIMAPVARLLHQLDLLAGLMLELVGAGQVARRDAPLPPRATVGVQENLAQPAVGVLRAAHPAVRVHARFLQVP